MARYLVHRNSWGSLATRSRHLQGAPFANVVSVSDGAPGNSTGKLLFYLTALDSSAYDLQARAPISQKGAQQDSYKLWQPSSLSCVLVLTSGFISLKVPFQGQSRDC